MKKRIIAIFLVTLCIVSLTACKKKEAEIKDTPTDTTVVETKNDTEEKPSSSTEPTATSPTLISPDMPETLDRPESITSTKTPEDTITKPTNTPTPTETHPEIEEIIDFTIPEVENEEDNFAIKEAKPNIGDSEGLSKFNYNGKEYNLTTLTLSDLNKSGVFLAEEDIRFYNNNGWSFHGDLFGLKNKQNTLNPPLKPFYIELSDKNTIEAIAVDKEDGKNIKFFRNIQCGMTSNEIAPLLKDAVKQQYKNQTFYIFKDSNTSLMFETKNGVVEFVILVKNSTMKDWVSIQ